MTLINKTPMKGILNLVIDNNNNILVITREKIYIYNLEGILINSWDLINYPKQMYVNREIICNKNEIFILEVNNSYIYVYSYEGKLIRSWCGISKCKNKNSFPRNIDIFQDIIFLLDKENYTIQAFTRYGKLIFIYKHSGLDLAYDMIIVDNFIYISNCYTHKIEMYKLICD